MSSLDQTESNAVLDGLVGTASAPTPTLPMKLRVTSTAPTATSDGTELPGGGGYTTGGVAITFASASAGAAATSAQILLTNSSGSSWTAAGVELWDSAGSPKRWWWGTITGGPLTIPNGDALLFAAGAITASI